MLFVDLLGRNVGANLQKAMFKRKAVKEA